MEALMKENGQLSKELKQSRLGQAATKGKITVI